MLLALIVFWLALPLLNYSSSSLNTSRDQIEYPSAIYDLIEHHPSAKQSLDNIHYALDKKFSGNNELAEQLRLRQQQIVDRVALLWMLPFRSGAALSYLRFAEGVMIEFFSPDTSESNPDILEIIDFDSWIDGGYRAFAGVLLRTGFVLMGFWPYWIVAGLIGYFLLPLAFRPKRTHDLLGLADRGVTPFYSGIYGPLNLNGHLSATDLSVPSLACPKLSDPKESMKHPLVAILRKYRAFNDTNLQLTSIILAHRDYPAYVEDERSVDDLPDDSADPSLSLSAAQTLPAQGSASAALPKSVQSNAEGTIEQWSVDSLAAALEAHAALGHYFQANSGTGLLPEDHYPKVRADLAEIAKSLSPRGQILLLALTAARAQLISRLPATVIATAYLAIEAGKSLVWQRVGTQFSQISRFPHLQARAVVQSIPSYHREYEGDPRLTIRQGIICSRKHGDFGRAFLPTTMPLASRGLRDWLEILFARPKDRQNVANLVELDAHLEELSGNWKRRLNERLVAELKLSHASTQIPSAYPLWKGMPYKSVVLMSLTSVVDIALHGIHESRCQRITELGEITKHLHATLSISARLPGFKRQALEARQNSVVSEDMAILFNSSPQGRNLVEKWFIVRRMLTRYNWLSTRVGDYNVPADGLISAVLIDRSEEGSISDGKLQLAPNVLGLDTMVPLRQRQFREFVGTNWENNFYRDAPHPNDISVFVDQREFKECLAKRIDEARRGLLSRTAAGGVGNGNAGSAAVG